jgi:hypothetical protein
MGILLSREGGPDSGPLPGHLPQGETPHGRRPRRKENPELSSIIERAESDEVGMASAEPAGEVILIPVGNDASLEDPKPAELEGQSVLFAVLGFVDRPVAELWFLRHHRFKDSSMGLPEFSPVCREGRGGDLLKFGPVDLTEQPPERLIEKGLARGSIASRLSFRVS